MKIKEYIAEVVKSLEVAEGSEVIGDKDVELIIGVVPSKNGGVIVDAFSPSKIKITIQVKRR